MIVRHFDGPLWGIYSPRYIDGLRRAARATPGMTWYAAHSTWAGYPDAIEQCLKRLAEFGLRVDGTAPFDPGYLRAHVPLKKSIRAGLREYQIEGVKFLVAHAQSGALLADDMGLGKQMPVDERVLTPHGWRKIGSLRIGDEVIGSDGKATLVTGVFPQGVVQNFKLIFSNAETVEAGAEHLWRVSYYKGGRVLTEIVLSTAQIAENIHRRYRVPLLSAPIEFAAGPKLPIEPYLLGQLIGNGSLTRGHVVLVSNIHDWLEIQARLTRAGISIGAVRTYGGATRVGLLGYTKAIRALGLDVKSAQKFVPRAYMRAAPSERLALLQGLMDSDGSCSKTRNRVVFHTTSKKLAEQVRQLVEQFGGIASVRAYDRRDEKKPIELQVRVCMPLGVNPFYVSRKASRYKPVCPPTRTIVRIEPSRKAESVCIRVAAKDSLYVTRHAILTHNTLTAIRAMKALRAPAVVVCPSVVREVWKREHQKWRPKARVIELVGVTNKCKRCKGVGRVEPKKGALLVLPFATCPKCDGSGKLIELEKLGRRDVVLVHYDIVHAWVKPLIEAGIETFVGDEGHYLQGDRSRRSTACRTLSHACRNRILLTGTPMTSRPRDLWSPVEVISPSRFGKPFDFYMRYADGKQVSITTQQGSKTVWDFGGASNTEELNRRLQWFMLRRTKTDVKLELPPRTRQIIEVEVPKAHRKQMSMTGRADRAAREALALAADGKLAHVVELVTSHVANGSKVVIAAHRRTIADAIAATLKADGIDARAVSGEMPIHKRQEIFDMQPAVLSATIDSIPVGIDLSYADVGVCVELDWTPSKLLQWEARLHRFGQQRNVLIQYVVALSTLDEIVRDQVIEKLVTFEKIVGRTDDKLASELDARMALTQAERLRKMAARLMAQSERGEI